MARAVLGQRPPSVLHWRLAWADAQDRCRADPRWIEEHSAPLAETRTRFRDICDASAVSGDIRRTVASLPKRLKLVIDADGGSIRY
jgi:hypothetical protein